MNLETYFKQFSKNIFIESNDSKITFLDFYNNCQKLASQIATLGIKKNNYVGIKLENSIESAETIFAIAALGAIPCLIPTRLKNLPDFLFDFVLSEENLNQVRSIEPNQSPELETEPSKLKVILWTSGSSSTPKAALLSFENLIWNALGSNENIPFTENDRWHWSLPQYHVGGLSILFRALVGGGSVTLNDNATHVSWVQTQLYRWLQQLNKNLKSILLGGSAISEELIKKCNELELPIHTSYGMTEKGSQIYTGKLLKYRELKVENGEIYVKGPTLFQGYVINNEIQRPLTHGWFATKDLGSYTDGKLTVLGRKDRMFISAGENIQPEFIEQAIMKYPGISRVRVLPVENKEYGIRPQAYVEGFDSIDFSDLKGFLKERLTGLQVPEEFLDFSKLPVSPTKDF